MFDFELTPEELTSIVDIQLEQLRLRLADRGLALELTPAAKSALAEAGYDPQFGARPLKRVIQQRLENPIATRILAGELEPGDIIAVDHSGHSFLFEKSAQTVASG